MSVDGARSVLSVEDRFAAWLFGVVEEHAGDKPVLVRLGHLTDDELEPLPLPDAESKTMRKSSAHETARGGANAD